MEWLKENWAWMRYVLLGIGAFILGWITGSGFMGRRTHGDIERLRSNLGELDRQLDEYKARLEASGKLHADTRQRLALAEAELNAARGTIDRLNAGIGHVDEDLEGLRIIRDRLGILAEKLREKAHD